MEAQTLVVAQVGVDLEVLALRSSVIQIHSRLPRRQVRPHSLALAGIVSINSPALAH